MEDMNDSLRQQYTRLIDAYRNKDGPKSIRHLAKSLNVEVPNGIEQIAITPDQAMDWAKRVVRIDRKFQQATRATGTDNEKALPAKIDLMAVPDEKLRMIELDPADIQGARLAFVQLYSRFALEVAAAWKPDATPEDISLLRGGGVFIEEWVDKQVTNITENTSFEKLEEQLTILAALKLMLNPMESVLEAGTLVVFADKVQKAREQ